MLVDSKDLSGLTEQEGVRLQTESRTGADMS